MAKEYYEFDTETKEISPTQEKKGGIREAVAKIDKWKLFKQVVGMAASGCASVVVNRYLKASLPEPQSAFESAVTGVGVYFITGIVGSKVSKYAEQELDEWRDSITEIKRVDDTLEEILKEEEGE